MARPQWRQEGGRKEGRKEAVNCHRTSADGPVVAPSHVAVGHAQAADALGALQLVALVAGEVHRGPPPAGGASGFLRTQPGRTLESSPTEPSTSLAVGSRRRCILSHVSA